MRRWSVLLLVGGLVASCVGDGEATDSTFPPSAVPVPSSSTAVETTESTPSTLLTPSTSSTSISRGDVVRVAVLREGVSDWFVDAEADPEERLVVAYQVEDRSVRVLRCRDSSCDDVDEMEVGYTPEFGELADMGLALLPDGSPVVVAQSWDTSSVTVHICVDPVCSSFDVVELNDPEPCLYPDGQPCQFSVDYPRIAVGSDGLVRVAYFYPGSEPTLRMATCQDRACSNWEFSTVAEYPTEEGMATSSFSFHIDNRDRAVVGYWWDLWEEISRSVVVVCETASCDTEPLSVFEIDGGVHPLTTQGPDDSFHVWYRTGFPSGLFTREDHEQGLPAILPKYSEVSDTMVAHCDADGCSEPQYVPPGEDWLLPFRSELRLFTFEDGTTGAFFLGGSLEDPVSQLHHTSCASPECATGETQALSIGIEVDGPIGRLDLVTTLGMPPRVVFVVNGTLQLFTCTNTLCTTS